jgi:hypothetical protein
MSRAEQKESSSRERMSGVGSGVGGRSLEVCHSWNPPYRGTPGTHVARNGVLSDLRGGEAALAHHEDQVRVLPPDG